MPRKSSATSASTNMFSQVRKKLDSRPEMDEVAELLNLAGNSTRFKMLNLLDEMDEVNVSNLSELLGVSVSAVSQHLAKLRAYGLVRARRDAQTIFYRLADHPFNDKLKEKFFFDLGA